MSIYHFSGDQKERGRLYSSCSCSWKLCAFTEKELETMRVTQELPGAPTIGGGSAQPGDGGWGSKRSQISLPSHLEYMKTVLKWPVALNDLKNTEKNDVFLL
jgi:hypothetical protein